MIQVPTSNNQASEKHQIQSFNRRHAATQKSEAWHLKFFRRLKFETWSIKHCVLLLIPFLFLGCRTAAPQITRPPNLFPAEALITQRGVLTTFFGRQYTLNGYLALSATHGQRLVLTENFGNVLADVLITPDGQTHVMKSSAGFKPEWIERYIAADVRCLFGTPRPDDDCPGQILSAEEMRIERRWYSLDLRTINIKTGSQPVAMFDPSSKETP